MSRDGIHMRREGYVDALRLNDTLSKSADNLNIVAGNG